MLFSSIKMYGQMPRLYTTQQGLKTSDIRGLSIDSRGIIWIAGSSAMEMFDGQSFYSVSLKDSTSGNNICDVVYGVIEINPLKKNENPQTHKFNYIVKTNSGLYHYNLSEDKFTRIYLSEKEKGQTPYGIREVLPYSKPGYMLIMTEGHGAYVFNANNLEVDHEETEKIGSAMSQGYLISAYIDAENNLWYFNSNHELHGLNTGTLKSITLESDDNVNEIITRAQVTCICEDTDNIYFGTQEGILYCQKTNDSRKRQLQFIEETTKLNLPVSIIKSIKKGTLLIGTDSYGLWELNSDANNKYTLEKSNFSNSQLNLDYGKVKCIEHDKEGNTIIAMLQKGLLIIPSHSETFRYHAISPEKGEINASCITSITVDKDLNYWITTDGCGVFTTDGMHLATARQITQGLNSPLVQDLIVDKEQNVWIGSYGGGVQRYEKDKFVTPKNLEILRFSPVMSLVFSQKQNKIYIGINGNGVYSYDIENEELTHLEQSSHLNPWIETLFIDENDKLWIGTANGLYYIDTQSGKSGEVNYKKECSQSVHCINKDKDMILFGTNEGLVLFNTKSNEYNYLLKDERVMSIEQTETDYWIAAVGSIFSIDKKKLTPTRYTSFGGFYLGEPHRSSCVRPIPDDILFGCDNGIICFTPSLIKQNTGIKNPLTFNSFRTNGKSHNTVPENITLAYENNSFSITFGVAHFSAPEQIHYEYMLEGYDKEWNACRNFPRAYYSSLAPGTYTLKVKAYNEADSTDFKTQSVTITVTPPWYTSTWAKIAYILFFIVTGYCIYRTINSRKKQKMLLQQAREQEKLKEAKLKTFTSITHEMRTPLTMIVAPLKQISSQHKDQETQSLCKVMKHNCDRLLNIVKQMTDIRHIDSGQLKLHFKEVDIVKYIDDILELFKANAKLKGISLGYDHNESTQSIWIDTTHFEKIIVNLLSNAMKFTPEGGSIKVSSNNEEDGKLTIKIFNSGSHINEEDIPHIFERFYQGDSDVKMIGSGIGLNLVQELTTLHHGQISVSNMNDGVEFTLTMPLGNSHIKQEEMTEDDNNAASEAGLDEEIQMMADKLEKQMKEENAANEQKEEESKEQTENTDEEQEEEKNDNEEENDINEEEFNDEESEDEENEAYTMLSNSKSEKTILVVDDDVELCEFIAAQMNIYYNVLTAHSGNSAWQTILKQRPDVIVTDIKMPDGNGIELCKRIKGNPETEYIPVIMLTSENDENAQMKSLELHVEYFLSKPFNLLMLRAAIGQVLNVREMMQKRISRIDASNNYETVSIDSADDKLFTRINEQIQKHIDDSEFGVESLAMEVGISRVHLNRKMKEKYGVTPRQFIKSFRLKQAAYLLVHNQVNISDVVYKLGFSSPSFFSSSFHEYFGMTPKEFMACYADHPDDETLKKLLE